MVAGVETRYFVVEREIPGMMNSRELPITLKASFLKTVYNNSNRQVKNKIQAKAFQIIETVWKFIITIKRYSKSAEKLLYQ